MDRVHNGEQTPSDLTNFYTNNQNIQKIRSQNSLQQQILLYFKFPGPLGNMKKQRQATTLLGKMIIVIPSLAEFPPT